MTTATREAFAAVSTGEDYLDRAEQVRRGALSGVELNLLIVARNIPHICALRNSWWSP